jgi:hypothetical protein
MQNRKGKGRGDKQLSCQFSFFSSFYENFIFSEKFLGGFVRFLFFAFVFYLNFVLIDAKLFFMCDK